ncbi:hypothetical protein J7E94_01015 [Streptomyces sp. ISL-94]|nr:hypothetical protein [Streptomyces sp. ISL-94]MBT2476881.1 hypothetical protein [Streptomyces sp. ISL-94]
MAVLLGQGAVVAVGYVGLAAGEHLEQDTADGVEVGGGGDGLQEEPLGGHVLGCAEELAGGGHAGGVSELADGGVGAGDAEVEQDQPVGGLPDHDVARFDVAVDEVAGVYGDQCVAELGGPGQGVGRGQPVPLGDGGAQGAALDELGDQVEVPGSGYLGLVHIVDADDVRIVDGREVPGLAQEAAGRMGAAVRDAEELGDDGAVQPQVAGLPDFCHASREVLK